MKRLREAISLRSWSFRPSPLGYGEQVCRQVITLLTLAFLGMPAAAFARDPGVIRPDGRSIQNVYSLRGRFMFINRVSKRHMRLVTLPQVPELLQKEII
jgi:hypothetical protein